MEQNIAFKVDSEWLCNFVRQRVYWEGLSFTEGIKLLVASFLGIDSDLATAILTGQKKIVGINGGDVVDDDKTSDYLAYIAREESRKLQEEVGKDILLHPYTYLDPFATRWSVKQFEEDNPQFSTCDYSVLANYFQQPPCDGDFLMEGGMYSVSTDFAHKKIESEEDKKAFYEQLYKYWNDYLEESKGFLSSADRMQIIIRQKSYEMWKTRDERREARLNKLLAEGRELTEHQKQEKYGAPIACLPDWVIGSDGTYTLCKGEESFYQRSGKFKPLDDKVFWEYGIISPTGDFYACTFASHNTCALTILRDVLHCKFDTEDWQDSIDIWNAAKDKLFNLGWCFVNTCWGIRVVDYFYSKYSQLEDMPQAMMDTCYDWLVWNRNRKEDD